MLLQRWEAKIRRKEKSPQPGIELTTTRSRVRHAHHWATQAGPSSSLTSSSTGHHLHLFSWPSTSSSDHGLTTSSNYHLHYTLSHYLNILTTFSVHCWVTISIFSPPTLYTVESLSQYSHLLLYTFESLSQYSHHLLCTLLSHYLNILTSYTVHWVTVSIFSPQNTF